MSKLSASLMALVTLVFGFGAGFALRPIVSSVITPTSESSISGDPRGTQYFIAHVDEARRVTAGCRDGSVRGGECATAEEAIIKADAEERRSRFLGN